MATTRLMPLHVGQGQTIYSALGMTVTYVQNPDKTDSGELISSYECDPLTVTEEFLFSKREYEQITGRSQGVANVIAYHLRQSFKPGEIDPATANKIGYELAMSLTKGRHAFIVCTHVDKAHVHSHIIFNSTALDCSRKFRNFIGSSFAVRRISDRLCLENGLSIIEKPKPSRGHYGTWLEGGKPPTQRDKLRKLIDNTLSAGMTFEEFLTAMVSAGCEVKQGQHLSIKAPGQERFIRCKSLGDDYTEDALRERLNGRLAPPSRQKTAASASPQKQNFLIDIEAKIQEGYGGGFVHWAKLVNLKQAARSLMFLQENNLTDYTELERRVAASSADYHGYADQIKAVDSRMSDIVHLQKHIGSYSKTREIYSQYRASGYSKKFYNAHADAIKIHRAAKKYFDEQGYGKDKKLPSMKSLTQEYATLKAKRGKLYQDYKLAYDSMRELGTIKYNTDVILGKAPTSKKPHRNGQEMSH